MRNLREIGRDLKAAPDWGGPHSLGLWRRVTHFVMFLTLITVSVWCEAKPPKDLHERRAVGLEIEYGVAPEAANRFSHKELAELLLEPILDMSKPKKKAVFSRWQKYRTYEPLLFAEARDPYGRVWRSEPERTNSNSYDGRELVTPPLTRLSDLEMVARVRREIESTAFFIPAPESSIHFNYDVSDLVAANGDAQKLVNVILFIEQHWPEIYRLVKPRRMGTIVNYFAVPLAFNQVSLLQQLARYPVERRTIREIGAIFRKFELLELKLMNGIPGRIWKFRAANYGKILKLFEEGSPSVNAPIIEFRISDFVDESKMREIDDLFLAIIEYAAQLPPITEFVPPFQSTEFSATDRFTDFSKINEQIQAVPYDQVKDFKNFIKPRSCVEKLVRRDRPGRE